MKSRLNLNAETIAKHMGYSDKNLAILAIRLTSQGEVDEHINILFNHDKRNTFVQNTSV